MRQKKCLPRAHSVLAVREKPAMSDEKMTPTEQSILEKKPISEKIESKTPFFSKDFDI